MRLLEDQFAAVQNAMPLGVRGMVQAVRGLTIEATDLPLPLGSLCRIHSFAGGTRSAEVIGFNGDRTLLMPLSSVAGVSRGDSIESVTISPRIGVGPGLLGRVIDGFGRPIDGKPAPQLSRYRRIDSHGPSPMQRRPIRQPIATSIRCVDALLTCGLGQRMGIFAGPGVGKSTFMSQLARHTSADISVVALIGERGREVQEFIEHGLGEEGLKRCVLIVSTGDDTPLLKVRAAKVACTVAEHFRNRGQHVLLMLDSLTRLAQAQRQIGLAAGEPPATKGFPPSVFALLPEVLERAGNTAVGSITGFYTVLVEGDDFNEPVPDAVKGITDGHIWLARELAERGHFPAIDVLRSISRVRGDVSTDESVHRARRIQSLLAAWRDIEDLVNIGAYVKGQDAENDRAVTHRQAIVKFLQQSSKEPTTLETASSQLIELLAIVDKAPVNTPKIT